jgi:hypothetical protein
VRYAGVVAHLPYFTIGPGTGYVKVNDSLMGKCRSTGHPTSTVVSLAAGVSGGHPNDQDRFAMYVTPHVSPLTGLAGQDVQFDVGSLLYKESDEILFLPSRLNSSFQASQWVPQIALAAPSSRRAGW